MVYSFHSEPCQHDPPGFGMGITILYTSVHVYEWKRNLDYWSQQKKE